MTLGVVVMLVGVFFVPIALLLGGHRLRRRSRRWRATFWGALIGYGLGAVASLIAGMIPPETWSDDDEIRGLFAFWALVLAPALGAITGVIRSYYRRSTA